MDECRTARTASAALFDCSRPTQWRRRSGWRLEQRAAICRRFLDPAFAEVALAGGDQRFDFVRGARLADRDQRDLGGIAARELGRVGDAVEDRLDGGSVMR